MTTRSERDGVDQTEEPAIAADDDDMAGPGNSVGMSLVLFEDPAFALDTDIDPEAWAAFAPPPAAEACLVQFAAYEADVSTGELIGLGRSSAVRFPRLGGVLHGRIAPHGDDAQLLSAGAELTIRAGYHAALATGQVPGGPADHDAAELWDAFVPMSYRVPRAVAARVWDVCRFDALWISLLGHFDHPEIEGDANRFAKGVVSPLSRSLRGLSAVGVALALAERGTRQDRPSTSRHPHRAVRGVRRADPRRRARWTKAMTPDLSRVADADLPGGAPLSPRR